MKITGNKNYIKFDLENGYVLNGAGEMFVDKKFVVYKDTMKAWEEPHENEEITEQQIENIIEEVKSKMNQNTVQIYFE